MARKRATPQKPGIYARITLFDEFGLIFQGEKKPIQKAEDQANEFLDHKMNSNQKIMLKGGSI